MRRTRLLSLVVLTVALVVPPAAAGVVSAAPAPPTAVPESAPAPQPAPALQAAAAAPQVLADGLSIPWGIAPLSDGGALVTERDSGKIWMVKPGVAPKVVYTVTETRPGGEGGLLGIALASDFASSKRFYVYYTTATDNRVARIVLGSSARPKPIVTGIPKGTIHNGGGMHIKPGKYLFIGTGDSGNSALAQDPSSLGGKILKVDSNGNPAPGNVWGRVFSIGHRNVQDLTFNAPGSVLWATELGNNERDEINTIHSGRNYGWPVCEGVCQRAGYMDPKWTWATSEASPSGITYVKTSAGTKYYVGALRGQRVWKLTPSGRTMTAAVSTLRDTYGRIRGVQGRGDGSLWIMTSNGNGTDKVLRFPQAP